MSLRVSPEIYATAAGNGAHLVVPFVFPSALSGHEMTGLHDIISGDLTTTGGRLGRRRRFLELDMGGDGFPAYLDPGVTGYSRLAHESPDRERNTETGFLTVLKRRFIERRRILPQRGPISRVILGQCDVELSEVNTAVHVDVGRADPAVQFTGIIEINGEQSGVFGMHFPSGEHGWAKVYDLKTGK